MGTAPTPMTNTGRSSGAATAVSAATAIAAACRVCGHRGPAPHYVVREMMFGSGERFPYFACAACGCLQILEIPADLAPYYPSDYWSPRRSGRVRNALRRRRDAFALLGRGVLGRVLLQALPYPFPGIREWVAAREDPTACRILDVGCGSGELLHDLARVGFSRVLGIDPFATTVPDAEVPVIRATLQQLRGSFDLIMFHHVLEHLPDQRATLEAVARLLAAEGRCLVRIPLASSYAWEHYRENWVQLDAPRHLYLHTETSLRRLAERAGLKVAAVHYDSDEFQFLGSELYRRGIPLRVGRERVGICFTSAQIRAYRRRADALNAQGRGDQAAFLLTRA